MTFFFVEYFSEEDWKIIGSTHFVKKLITFMKGTEEKEFMGFMFELIDSLRGRTRRKT